MHILEASDYISDPSDYDDDDEINLPEAYQDVQDDIDECDHVLADLEEGPVREQVKKRRMELGFHEEMLGAAMKRRGEEPDEETLESCMKRPEEPSEEEAERLRKN